MEETMKFGPFVVKVTPREFSVIREGSGVTFRPASSEQAVNLIVHAMRIEDMKLLPGKLVNSPFTIFFDKDRSMRLKESFQSGDGISFTFAEGDTLKSSIQIGLDKWLDMYKANKSGFPVPSSTDPDNPPFDVGH